MLVSAPTREPWTERNFTRQRCSGSLPSSLAIASSTRTASSSLTSSAFSSMAVDAIRSAFESLGEGDVEPLVALIHPDMEWRGRRRLSRFWDPPS